MMTPDDELGEWWTTREGRREALRRGIPEAVDLALDGLPEYLKERGDL